MQLSRRQFMKVTGSTLAGSSLALMGFSPSTALAEVRQYKLAATTVTRQTCTYCSVGCGILMHSLGDGAKNAKLSVIHVEGDKTLFPRFHQWHAVRSILDVGCGQGHWRGAADKPGHRLDVGLTAGVGDEAVGRRATSNAGDPTLPREVGDLLHEQEVRCEPQSVDRRQLVAQLTTGAVNQLQAIAEWIRENRHQVT